MSSKIKRGEEVVVISGANKGQRGRVLQVTPKSDRVVIEGVNFRKKHQKARSEEEEGGIIEREAPLHISNVMAAERYDERQKKRG
ncbi:MAG: 50S ribosomal protein L24 [Opitutales bacterium]|nr:50S ribosomal protein L24 [Opitutales bacterium]